MSIDAASSNRTTPLWEAASNGHIRIIQFLVENGADVNAFDAQGVTPLYIALSREDCFIFKTSVKVFHFNIESYFSVWREVANYLLQKGATGLFTLQNTKSDLLNPYFSGACLQNQKGGSSAVPVGDFSWMVSIGHWQHQAKTKYLDRLN